jgi:hypothetical protein
LYMLNCLLGFTPKQLQPTEDFTLLDRFCLGLVHYQIILNKKWVLPHTKIPDKSCGLAFSRMSSLYFTANPMADGHVLQEVELSPIETVTRVPVFLAMVATTWPPHWPSNH